MCIRTLVQTGLIIIPVNIISPLISSFFGCMWKCDYVCMWSYLSTYITTEIKILQIRMKVWQSMYYVWRWTWESRITPLGPHQLSCDAIMWSLSSDVISWSLLNDAIMWSLSSDVIMHMWWSQLEFHETLVLCVVCTMTKLQWCIGQCCTALEACELTTIILEECRTLQHKLWKRCIDIACTDRQMKM